MSRNSAANSKQQGVFRVIKGRIKDLFTVEVYEDLARKIKSVYPAFDSEGFIQQIFCPEWGELEMAKRIRHSAAVLDRFLPDDYIRAVDILTKALAQFTEAHWRTPLDTPAAMLFPAYIDLRGLEDWETSEKAMHAITPYASCEITVRPFIEKYGHEMIRRMTAWADSDSEYIRRLASEGTRISIPMGPDLKFVKDNPETILPLLDKLMCDPSEDVRKSVANNLNEMSKSAKRLMLDFCKAWLGKNKETDKIIKHALRTLLKNGDAEAMAMFGMNKPEGISIEALVCDKHVDIGGALHFSFHIVNSSGNPQKIRIGYDLCLPGAYGKMNLNKVRISERLCPSGKIAIERKHPIVNTSARTLKPGESMVKITINGEIMAEEEFLLKPTESPAQSFI